MSFRVYSKVYYKNFMDFLLRNFMFFSFKSNKKFVNINSIPKKLASTLMAQTINAFEVFVLFTRYTQFARIHLHGQCRQNFNHFLS